MRAYERQHSDNQVINRTTPQKRLLERELVDAIKGLKPTVSPTHRSTLLARLSAIRADIKESDAKSAR